MQATRENIRSVIDEVLLHNEHYKRLEWDQLVTFINARHMVVRDWDQVRAVLQEYVNRGTLRQTSIPGTYRII